jgi:hypothetical protein
MVRVIALLNRLSIAPKDEKEFDTWIELRDVVPFLRGNAIDDELIVQLSASFAFLRAVVVPKSNVDPPDIEDLVSWNLDSSSSWGIEVHYLGGTAKSISIEEPMSGTCSKSFRNGEQLVFSREFDGRQGEKHYYEILQKFAHVFDLHFLPERNAYCRLDTRGDVEDVVRIIEIPGRGDRWGTSVVTFNRAVLDEYLALTESVLVTAFDFTRFRPDGFGDWKELGAKELFAQDNLFYRHHIESGHASYMRGVHIVRSGLPKEAIIERRDPSVEKKRDYASFVAWDFKNKALREISTAPGSTANYFTKSDLPFEMSPVFFRPEVLLKYKSDSDKYRLEDRSVSCRNAWHLQTYDINEVGQVHTYLVYLRGLPHEEQLYWKSYNERPKAPISRRALTTDFEGDFYAEYDPLASLKGIMLELDHTQVPWWTLRSEKLASRVHYPVTSSTDEWSNEILQLDQMLVEGFETKWLRKKAIELGRNPNPNFRSLKLVEECLMALGWEEGDARRVTAPMHELHDLRSKIKGHASGDEATAIRKQVLAEHGNYGKHFRALCSDCDEGLRTIAEQFTGLE